MSATGAAAQEGYAQQMAAAMPAVMPPMMPASPVGDPHETRPGPLSAPSFSHYSSPDVDGPLVRNKALQLSSARPACAILCYFAVRHQQTLLQCATGVECHLCRIQNRFAYDMTGDYVYSSRYYANFDMSSSVWLCLFCYQNMSNLICYHVMTSCLHPFHCQHGQVQDFLKGTESCSLQLLQCSH